MNQEQSSSTININNSNNLKGSTNYGVRKFKIKIILMREGLWDLVDLVWKLTRTWE